MDRKWQKISCAVYIYTVYIFKIIPFELGGIIIGHVESVPKLSISVYTRGRYTAHLPLPPLSL